MADDEDNKDHLSLTLGLSITDQPPPAKPRSRTLPRETTARSVRRRVDKCGAETIPAPYPWATDRPCRFQTVTDMKRDGQASVTGSVKCKKCERSYEMAFDLDKFFEIGLYFMKNKEEMGNRAPAEWKNPRLPECRMCGEKNAAAPEIAGLEKTNWMFLFLGEMIGCCGLQDLKYFLLMNDVHRTAGKDWLLYDVYVTMLKQLDPNAPFGK